MWAGRQCDTFTGYSYIDSAGSFLHMVVSARCVGRKEKYSGLGSSGKKQKEQMWASFWWEMEEGMGGV